MCRLHVKIFNRVKKTKQKQSKERKDSGMEAYTGFAKVYDTFMDNIPYDKWSEYLISLLKEYQVKNGLVLDLGCGTGNITEYLAATGYNMIGIDNSEDMLAIAIEKRDKKEEKNADGWVASEEDGSILYLYQDMREFELYGTVSAIISICDSMNYIMSEEDLLKVFKLVSNYLDKKGVFIFDLNTVYKYKTILGDNTIAENREECSFIWENYYYEDEMINEYDLTIYVKDNRNEGKRLYQRFEENHFQKAYTLDTVKNLLEKAGLEFVAAYDAFTREPPQETSERIYIIAREQRHEGKTYIDEMK